jgi:hypothetical protein
VILAGRDKAVCAQVKANDKEGCNVNASINGYFPRLFGHIRLRH